MRFMIIVKATQATEAATTPEDGMKAEEADSLIKAMADYHELLVTAGILLDGNGLHPTSRGARICYSGAKPTVIDGPFTETKELIAGYTIIQVKSREEAFEWAKRFPNPSADDGEIEVRQMFELDDFPQSEAVEAKWTSARGGSTPDRLARLRR